MAGLTIPSALGGVARVGRVRLGRSRRSDRKSRTAVPTRSAPDWDGLRTYHQGPEGLSWTDPLMRPLAWEAAPPCENCHIFEGPEGPYWTEPLMCALAWDTLITCEYRGTFRSKERLHGFRREFINADRPRLLPRRTTGVARGQRALLREIVLHRRRRACRGVRGLSPDSWPRRCRSGRRWVARRSPSRERIRSRCPRAPLPFPFQQPQQ